MFFDALVNGSLQYVLDKVKLCCKRSVHLAELIPFLEGKGLSRFITNVK